MDDLVISAISIYDFENGNKVMNEKYNGEFPWQKEI